MVLAAVALLSQAAVPWVPSPSFVSAEVARQAVIGCGIPASAVVAEDDSTLQETVIRVRTKDALAAERLSCVATESLRTIYYVFFTRAATQRAYDRIYYRLQDVKERRDARQAMADHGLLDKLPAYDPARDDLLVFAGKLEALCDIVPGTMLALAGSKLLTFKPNGMTTTGEGAFACLMNAVSASNLADHGVLLGFLSNKVLPNRNNR